MSSTQQRLSQIIKKIDIIISTPGALRARFRGCYYEVYRTLFHLHEMGIEPTMIFDVGANRGIFSLAASMVFPNAKIHAFEPLHDCFQELDALRANIPNLICYNVALGSASESRQMHRSKYDYSSSLLQMTSRHKTAFPYTAQGSVETISVRTLDELFPGTIPTRPSLMKIDVQGYEGFVIDGAEDFLKQIDFLICEMSLVSLYEGQPLYDEIYQKILTRGFRFAGQVGELSHPETNEVLQVDQFFVRKS